MNLSKNETTPSPWVVLATPKPKIFFFGLLGVAGPPLGWFAHPKLAMGWLKPPLGQNEVVGHPSLASSHPFDFYCSFIFLMVLVF
jgi:hypothetical protein